MTTVSGSRRKNGHVGRRTAVIDGVEVPLTKKGQPDGRWKRRLAKAAVPEVSSDVASASTVSEVPAKGGVSREVPSKRGGVKRKVAAAALARQESVECGELVERGDLSKLKRCKEPVRAQISTFRQRCRDIVMDEDVQRGVLARAQEDPDFAVKLANQGFGNVPQSVEVTANVDITKREIVYVVELQGGKVVPPSVAGLSDAGLILDSDGRSDDQRAAVGKDVHGG